MTTREWHFGTCFICLSHRACHHAPAALPAAPPPAGPCCSFLASKTSSTTGTTLTATIPKTTSVKLCCTTGRLPKKYPAPRNSSVHSSAPPTLYMANLLYDMLPMPATNGANVRTMGTKRASTTVLPPYLS
eukprot:GHRR01022047.1.p1 GENE.GHRR01022047.1~~GHRR01022047.1.p1  ORF type:complete len:131 (-),score=18.75 GHRR01022047.1:475-867(-)